MKVAFVTAEMAPFAKTGGLGDVLGTLPFEISALGHTVKAFIPFYKEIAEGHDLGTPQVKFKVQLAEEVHDVRVLSHNQDGVEIIFIDIPELFDRDGIYGTELGDHPDNHKRFGFLQAASLEWLKSEDFKPDIIHCHDWHAGLLPFFIKQTKKGDEFFEGIKTVHTIHNLAYQGIFPKEAFDELGFSDKRTIKKIADHGQLNFMKIAFLYADKITTVSETHAKEILTKQFACGLLNTLKARKKDVSGIINGIKLDDWNPEIDPDLTIRFSPLEFSKKMANKAILQKENKLEVNPDIPLFGLVSRLVDQKGLDILIPILKSFKKLKTQLILLGVGNPDYHKQLEKLASQFPDFISVQIGFDELKAKRIYAGSDIFLMPSKYEPCGIGQLIAMRYGTVPLVRKTGGLADTVQDFNTKSGEGNGIVFKPYTEKALLSAMKKAIELYKNKENWQAIIKNGFECDYSWEASARKYIELYRSIE